MIPSELDLVHARIILVEHLRGTGPGLQKLSNRLINDSFTLALRLTVELSAEMARRYPELRGESQES